jgi:hypothetical protein
VGFKHRIDHDNRALYATADGPITFGDIRDHLFKERYENGLMYAELIDARTARPAFSSEEVRELVSLLNVFAKGHALGPTAVVVSTDAGLGALLTIEALAKDICAIRPFLDVDTALKWLRDTRRRRASSGWSPALAVAHTKAATGETITAGEDKS